MENPINDINKDIETIRDSKEEIENHKNEMQNFCHHWRNVMQVKKNGLSANLLSDFISIIKRNGALAIAIIILCFFLFTDKDFNNLASKHTTFSWATLSYFLEVILERKKKIKEDIGRGIDFEFREIIRNNNEFYTVNPIPKELLERKKDEFNLELSEFEIKFISLQGRKNDIEPIISTLRKNENILFNNINFFDQFCLLVEKIKGGLPSEGLSEKWVRSKHHIKANYLIRFYSNDNRIDYREEVDGIRARDIYILQDKRRTETPIFLWKNVRSLDFFTRTDEFLRDFQCNYIQHQENL